VQKPRLVAADFRVETDSHHSYMSNCSEIVMKDKDHKGNASFNVYDVTKPGTPFEEIDDPEKVFALAWRQDLASSSEELSVDENMSS
jgi:hypothetical protein